MRSSNSNGSRAAWARGFMALFAIMLALGLGLAASPAEAAPFAYVTNFFDDTVSVIDTATNTVVATIPVVRTAGPYGVAVTPDGKHAYVTNDMDGTVSVIDTVSNTVVGTPIPVGITAPPPRCLAFCPQRGPRGIAITPDGKHAYVANNGSNNVSVIGTATKTVEAATIPVGNSPEGIAVTPDGKHAYVANSFDGTVSVIDTASNTVVATVPLGTGPLGIAITPDGKHAYVAGGGSDTVSVIDTASNTVEATVRGSPGGIPAIPFGVAVTPDGKHAYVTESFGTRFVSVIDTATNTVEAAPILVAGQFDRGIAVTQDGKHAYVANEDVESVSVIDTATNTVVATIPGGKAPLAWASSLRRRECHSSPSTPRSRSTWTAPRKRIALNLSPTSP